MHDLETKINKAEEQWRRQDRIYGVLMAAFVLAAVATFVVLACRS